MLRLAALESGASPPIPAEQEVRGLFNARRFVEFEARTAPSLERYPNWALSLKVLGIALQMQGKNGLAALQRVLALLPDDAEAHMNLGLALQTLGQFEAALVLTFPLFDAARFVHNLDEALRGMWQASRDSGRIP